MINNSISWHIRHAVGDDLINVSKLRSLFNDPNGSNRRAWSPNYYDWKIYKNINKPGVLLVSAIDQDVVGITTLTPKRFLFNGVEFIGAEIGDTFTHPNYQRQGMFSKLVLEAVNKADNLGLKFIYGTPNNLSLPGYCKLNFHEMTNVRVMSMVRPLHFSNVFKTFFKSKVVVSILSPIFNLGFKLYFRLAKKDGRFVVGKVNEFPEEIGDFSSNALKNVNLSIKRDKSYLDWRFVKNPDEYQIWICKLETKIVGYLVGKMGLYGGLKIGYLADFLVEDGRRDVLEALLYEAGQYFDSVEADLVSAWVVKKSGYDAVLKRNGFLEYKPVPVICANSKFSSVISRGVVSWHFTLADSDNI